MINLKADKSTRIVLVFVVILIVLLALVLHALQNPTHRRDAFLERPSTFFTDKTGARGAFLIAQKLLPNAIQYRKSFLELDFGADTLVVMGPSRSIKEGEISPLEDWLKAGGQLILAVDDDWEIYNDEDWESKVDRLEKAIETDEEKAENRVTVQNGFLARMGFVLQGRDDPPSGASGGVLDLDGDFEISGHQVFQEHLNFSLAASKTVGNGRMIVIPDKSVFSNQRLKDTANAVWLVEQIAGWGDGTVFFDEYHHGFVEKEQTRNLFFAFLFSPWGAGFIQLGLAGLLVFLGPLRRFGSIIEEKIVQQYDPLELIQARAQVFRRAQARVYGFEMMHSHLLERLGEAGMFAVKSTFNRRPDDPANSEILARYLTLYRKVRDEEALSEQEFIQAAALSGKLLEEYHHD